MREDLRVGTLFASIAAHTVLCLTPMSAEADAAKPVSIPVTDARGGTSRGSVTISVPGATLAVAFPHFLTRRTAGQAFYLSSPPRIVIDIPGVKSAKGISYPVEGHAAIRSIRVGAHSDKLRIVADLVRERSTELEVTQTPHEMRVSVGAKAATPQVPTAPSAPPSPSLTPTRAVAATPTPTATATVTTAATKAPTETPIPLITPTGATPTSVPVPTNSPAPATATNSPSATPLESFVPSTATATNTATYTFTTSVPPTNTAIHTATPPPTATMTPSATPTTKQAEQAGTPATVTATPPTKVSFDKGDSPLAGEIPAIDKLLAGKQGTIFTGYGFEYLAPNKTPVLKIKMNRPRFQAQFSKVDPKTYRVTIPNASVIGPHVTLPQFPPADFTGFVMVTAQQVGDSEKSVEISIVIEEGVTLGSFVREDEIVIKRM